MFRRLTAVPFDFPEAKNACTFESFLREGFLRAEYLARHRKELP
jgi:hypothetical protein